MSPATRKWLRDAAERVGWTAAQAAVAAVAVEVSGLPPAYAVPAAAILAAIKTYVAKHVGNKESASIGGA